MTGFSISFLVKVKITAQFSQFKTIFSSVKFIPAFQCRWCFLHLQDYVISISCNMCACATCLPVDSCACCTVQFTDVARQKKSIICQQVQHNFEQYTTRLKKKIKTRSTRKKNNYLSLKFTKSTEIWAYMLIQIKVKVWVCTREVIYSLRNSSALWLIKYFKIERSNPACNNCMSPARHITPHHLTIKPRRPGFRRRWQILCPIFSEIWIFQNLNALWRHKMLRGV